MSGGSTESVHFAAERRALMGVAFADAEVARTQIATYRQLAQEAGWDPPRDQFLFAQICYVGESDAEARETLSKHHRYYQTHLFGPAQAMGALVAATAYYRDEANREFRARRRAAFARPFDVDDQIEKGYVLCGAPATVVEQLRRTVRAVGHGIHQLSFQTGSMPHAQVLASMERFEKQVLPYVRDL
jgi:alkanesulfonate monooxygenase SsuD/methylene tetrahydromethanopterin reductase-like flavin-dependent oxidoreductase (luciferase family)